ncbi:hypothetical protein PBY51_006368 [Eleginops maclovinus]|uniref:Disintegrin and metalloproteinase domain-containing protein 17 n=1 Tax=Eleginops maclovinus TaxID=56733 RepID=A0AAN7X399_ELEMC|nr:hypothetical protein PBY51_006368 [Eleginops maclovinus]
MRLQLCFLTVFTVLRESAAPPPAESEDQHYTSLRLMLEDFDVLPLSALQTHSVRRRDLQTLTHLEKLVSFNALQRQFRLYLRTNEQLHNYFTGHVIGEEHSRVQAHFDDHEFSAHILTDEAEYNIEPLWRFTPSPPDGRLLIYRSEDIRNLSRLQQPSVCGYVTSDPRHLLPDGVRPAMTENQEEEAGRARRQVLDHRRNTCPLLLVADHRFFKHMGREEESTTLNYLIELIDRVDDIYRNTSWDDEFTGYGVQIQQIIIKKTPTLVAPGKTHFNMRGSPVGGRNVWDVKKLLEQFSDFDEGTLGLAYVAPSKPDIPGGLCSKVCPSSPNEQRAIYLNTGLTSTKNYGKTILTKEADLDQGGKYVMYPIAVSGDHANNKMFSDCSRRSIVKRLRAKAPSCFRLRNINVCGNSRVEQGEECDPGLLHIHLDHCCTAECKLTPGAQCSDRNSACCNNCGSRPGGKSARSPSTPPAKDIHTAQLPLFVETNSSCRVCCRSRAGVCAPYQDAAGSFLFLRKGKPCTVGFCDGAGKCMKQVQDVVERLWDFIDKLDINTLGKFLADNIVGSVVAFSLLLWAPFSVLVHCMDKKLDKQYEQTTKSLFFPSNAELLSSLESASDPPPQDGPRMATIEEDSNLDSQPFGRPGGGQRSYEDLTRNNATFKLKRQNQIHSKETQC